MERKLSIDELEQIWRRVQRQTSEEAVRADGKIAVFGPEKVDISGAAIRPEDLLFVRFQFWVS